MNNQPLPKPTKSQKQNPPKKGANKIVSPPSAIAKKVTNQAVVFDGNKAKLQAKSPTKLPIKQPTKPQVKSQAKSRIPLVQKPVPSKPSNIPKNPKTNSGIQLPPTSLSALSSMSSNTIPGSNGVVSQPNQTNSSANAITAPVQKTVLGRPLPHSIRGEAIPKGLTSAGIPGVKPAAVQKPNSGQTIQSNQIRINTQNPQATASAKMSPVPVSQNSSITKGGSKNKNDKNPKFANEKKSVFKFLPFIIGGIAILAVIGFIASKFLGGSSSSIGSSGDSGFGANSNNTNSAQQNPTGNTAKRTEVPAEQTELIYWGLWEPNEIMEEIITDFETSNPGVKITYVKQSHKDYRERLQTALDNGTGPDLFRFHASWTPMLKSNLGAIPSSIISAKEFSDDYYPIVTDQLVVGGQYVGVPLMYDGLALYYNEDILDSANEVPPATWPELRLLASKLTVKSANGIERAGLAIGNTSNVDHFSDILAVLMLQNGADFNDPNSQETQDALLFYTNFILKDEVWSETLPSSTIAFARGDVAMMFAPSWRAHDIAAQNPDLNFKTMTLPQLSDERITWGSYWAEGVNSGGKNIDVAASFIGFMSSEENLMKLFSKASEVRGFGEIYPKASMAEKLVDNEVVFSYLEDAVYAQSWYLNSFTHDNGINDLIIAYYEDAVNALLEGEDVEDVLLTIEAGTKQVLKQYGISAK